jgi:hypothetical protein
VRRTSLRHAVGAVKGHRQGPWLPRCRVETAQQAAPSGALPNAGACRLAPVVALSGRCLLVVWGGVVGAPGRSPRGPREAPPLRRGQGAAPGGRGPRALHRAPRGPCLPSDQAGHLGQRSRGARVSAREGFFLARHRARSYGPGARKGPRGSAWPGGGGPAQGGCRGAQFLWLRSCWPAAGGRSCTSSAATAAAWKRS